MIDSCLQQGISFNQETTLVGTMKTIKKAKALGYFVDMYFVGVENVEIAIKRVADRVRLVSFSNGSAQFGHHELSDSWFRRLLHENE